MTDPEYRNDPDDSHKLAELDRLINDPDVPIEPDRVWSLLAELAVRERWGAVLQVPAARPAVH
jgi:hypothetical protein